MSKSTSDIRYIDGVPFAPHSYQEVNNVSYSNISWDVSPNGWVGSSPDSNFFCDFCGNISLVSKPVSRGLFDV